MANYLYATLKGLRAALIADAGVSALVADRVVEDPRQNIAFPYIRFGNLDLREDDTDHTRGAVVAVGLEVHSRPDPGGRIEALTICEAIQAALHKRPAEIASEGFAPWEVEVAGFTVTRAPDGATFLGTVSVLVSLDA
jgi:hypothetical protein